MAKNFCKFIIFLLLFLLNSSFVFAAETVTGYAWIENYGWLNFGCDNCDARITDTALTGYAWNENIGRIILNPATGGVSNNIQGTLSGYAWSENAGWINFSGVNASGSGTLTGQATGDYTGTVNFSCDYCNVETDWRPQSNRGGTGPGAVFNPVDSVLAGSFNVSINNKSPYTNNPAVSLELVAGADIEKMVISNSPDFENAVQENYQSSKQWTLTSGDEKKTVYVKFFNQYGQSSAVIESSIVLDTEAPEIEITGVKDKYSEDEDVLIKGKTEPNAKVILLIDYQNYGFFTADKNGDWVLNLGKMAVGKHSLEFSPEDLAGNKGKTITADFFVEEKTDVSRPPSIVEKIKEKLIPFLPDFLKPKKDDLFKPVVTVPKLPPLSLRGGWEYLDPEPIKRFALAPLPKELAVLKEKLPQIEKLFASTGVEKMTDVQKIKDSRLSLPGLTETIAFSMPAITTGKFSQTKAVPLTQLTAPAKNKIPSDIVFVKAGGGMIDYNIALSLNDKGNTQQKIAAVSGQSMEFIVKPDKPVKRVVGYIVFKSKKPKESSFNVPLNKLAVSAIMQNPEFVMPAALSLQIPVEGSSLVIPSLTGNPESVEELLGSRFRGNDNEESGNLDGGEVETRLVLLKFEYEDTGNGVYSATVQAPVVEGEYEVITVMEYEDSGLMPKEIRLITVVDPEGYVYKKSGDLESRVPGAVAYLYWLNPETKQYELWPAGEYQQENPQVTGPSGTYSFLVPNGYYYLKVETPGYLSYDGKPFQVTEGSGVHINIELKTRYWWISLVNWQTVLLVLMAGLLLYNFYKDKKREKIIK